MKRNDIVRVSTQPENQFVFLEGIVGFIVSMEGDYAQVHQLTLDDSLGGFGTIPISCLKPERGEEWVRAYRVQHAAVESILAGLEEWPSSPVS